jgi:hypothetical protein
MHYILVVCAGHLCLPVETVGAYTLTRAECEARMMQVPGADVRCYSDFSWELWDDKMVLREPEHGIGAIAHPH